MSQELSFHQSLISKLEADNHELRDIVAHLEDSVATLEKRDTEYAASALRETKTLQEMQRKAALIQASIQQIRAGESNATSVSAQSSTSASASGAVSIPSPDDQSLWSLQTELQKLQGLSALKVRESAAISHQLSMLHTQTNDVMTVTLEALANVKMEISARRKKQFQRDVAQYRENLAELARGMYQPQGRKAIGTGAGSSGSNGGGGGIEIQSDPRCPPPSEPQLDPRRLTLADFSVADRERVLQLIFEALNRSSTGADGASAGDAQQKEETRPSSAVSLYTGGSAASRSGSSTSLVLSRPASSTRGPGSRPASSTRGSRPLSSTRTRPSPPPAAAGAGAALAAVDMRPSEYERLAGLAAAGAGGRAHKAHAQHLKQRRHSDEKETAFFPPRGDTPTELL